MNGFKGTIQIACSSSISASVCVDLPRDVKVQNGPALAIVALLFPAKTPLGTYTVTFKGVSGAVTSSATATFTIE